MKWKNLPSWLKGGIIANIIQIIFYILGITTFIIVLLLSKDNALYNFGVNQINLFGGGILTGLVWLMLIAFLPTVIIIELKIFGDGSEVLGIIFGIIVYFLFGALIGWIIGKIKSLKIF